MSTRRRIRMGGPAGQITACTGFSSRVGPHRGRLVVPGFLYKEGEPGEVPGVRGGLLYSDDHGETWTVGAVLPEGSDEVSLVETAGGEIYVSYRRNTCRRDGRTFARSRDGGQGFCELGEHEDLSGRPVHVGLAPAWSGCQQSSGRAALLAPHGRESPDPRRCGHDNLREPRRGTYLAGFEAH